MTTNDDGLAEHIAEHAERCDALLTQANEGLPDEGHFTHMHERDLRRVVGLIAEAVTHLKYAVQTLTPSDDGYSCLLSPQRHACRQTTSAGPNVP